MNVDFARRQMVRQQVRAWDVSDETVLNVIAACARERFVPPDYSHLAFADTEIPIGRGQYMMRPIVEGRVLQALEISQDDHVLEIGTGSGYLTACLSTMAASVTSIDIHDDFVTRASERLRDVGIDNVALEQMDATGELPGGEFDAIAVTGSVPQFDQRFVEVLRPGGRLFVVVGESPVMAAQLVTKGESGSTVVRSLFETVLAPLENAGRPPVFTF